MFKSGKTALLRRFVEDESGISAVEYGLLAAGIAVGIWAVVGDVGDSLNSIFGNVSDRLDEAAAEGGGA